MYKWKIKMYTYQIKEAAYINNRRIAAIKYSIAAALIVFIFATSFIPNFIGSRNKSKQKQVRYPTDMKYILIWTHSKNKRYMEYSLGQTAFVKQNCPAINCYISYDKDFLKQDIRNFDAVIFDIREVVQLNIRQLRFNRSEHQIYVLHSLEPASKIPICNARLNDYFNWTWTYKLDSDVPHPFFNIHDIRKDIIGPQINMTWLVNLKHDRRVMDVINNKTKAIAWIVTQCKVMIKHKKFIEAFKAELSGYNYTLDIYGACGHNTCPGKTRYRCYEMIEKDYFFSLVTEESTSEDWVTEKILNSLNRISIPVVVGGANYSRFLPPGSYIDVKTLPMKEVVAVLDYLILHPDTYSFFFDWKNHYYYTPRSRAYLCDLCSNLNKNNTWKSYGDIRGWWNPQFRRTCKKDLSERVYSSMPDYGEDNFML